MTHPYSIYVWRPGRTSTDTGTWIEPIQAYTQEYALYVANLIHKDSHAVIKVVRFGITLACFPDEKTVERIEQFIARQQEQKWLRACDEVGFFSSRIALLLTCSIHCVAASYSLIFPLDCITT